MASEFRRGSWILCIFLSSWKIIEHWFRDHAEELCWHCMSVGRESMLLCLQRQRRDGRKCESCMLWFEHCSEFVQIQKLVGILCNWLLRLVGEVKEAAMRNDPVIC